MSKGCPDILSDLSDLCLCHQADDGEVLSNSIASQGLPLFQLQSGLLITYLPIIIIMKAKINTEDIEGSDMHSCVIRRSFADDIPGLILVFNLALFSLSLIFLFSFLSETAKSSLFLI